MVKESISCPDFSSLVSKRYDHRGYDSKSLELRGRNRKTNITALTKRLTINDSYDRENRVRLEWILQKSLGTIAYENQVSNIKNTETYHETAEIRKDMWTRKTDQSAHTKIKDTARLRIPRVKLKDERWP